jgi:hypothetical protein|tara:strand:- start:44 stop:496 length:453 start_codon:yes stop_codon:yes gene_type:complete
MELVDMNSITVTGGKSNQRKYVESIAEFCIETLMPRMKTLDISIKLCTPKGAMGYCLELEDNRTFEIELDRSLSHRKLLETIAHEMVHVKQYARRELNPTTEVWMGKTYNPKKVSYWDLPWEIEAHGREVGLFIRWAEKQGIGHYNWVQV